MEKTPTSLEALKRDANSYYGRLPSDLHHEVEKFFKHPSFEWIMHEHAKIHGYFPRSFATPDKYIAYATVDKKRNRFIAHHYSPQISIWSVDPWEFQESLQGGCLGNSTIVFDAKNNHVLSSGKNAIYEWNLNTKQIKVILENVKRGALAIDKKRNHLILGEKETGEIKFFDLRSLLLQKQLKTNLLEIVSVTIDKHNHLIAGSRNGCIDIWDIETFEHQKTLNDGQANPIEDLAVDKKNNHLFVESSKILTIWDLNNYKQLHRLILPTTGYITYIDAKTKQIYCIDQSQSAVVIYNLEDPALKKILDTADADITLLISSIYEAIRNKTKLDLSDKSRKKAFELLPPTLQKTLQQKLQ